MGRWDNSVLNEAIKQIPSVPFQELHTPCPYAHCFIKADNAGYIQTNICAHESVLNEGQGQWFLFNFIIWQATFIV